MSELFEHQKQGIEFLKGKKRAILADEMGLGKTRQAIIAMEEDTKGETGFRLVIVPASLKINWKREIEMVAKSHVQIIESGPEQGIDPIGWVVINYDMLPKYMDQLRKWKDTGWILGCIIDEAHYIKGKKAIRANLALEIVTGLSKVYILTGTPIMNRPAELYNLLKAIDHPLGRYGKKTFFFKRYCGRQMRVIPLKTGRIVRFWDDTGATNMPELHSMLEGYLLRRKKEDVLDLPEKMVSVEMVELDKEWKIKYDNAWDEYIAWVEGHIAEQDLEKRLAKIENILNAQSLVELMKLKQVCSKAKTERIVEDIGRAVEESKVIVFTQFTETVEIIREELRKMGIKSVRLTGEDDMDARQEAVDAFQSDPETKVFVANIKAGGVGLNLTAASHVMFADMEWSPAIHDQATDRAHRIGQKGTVNVYYYVCEQTIEEDIVEILQRKLQTIQAVIDGKDAPEDGSLGAEFLERLKARVMGTTR